jgi:hypothetical protein
MIHHAHVHLKPDDTHIRKPDTLRACRSRRYAL